MYVPVLGSFLEIEEAIIVLCIIIVAYLTVMHIEFKQLKLVSKKFSKEDEDFVKCIRDLKTDINNLSDMVRTKEIRTISSHVSGNAASLKQKEPEPEKAVEKEPSVSKEEAGSESGSESQSKDTKSLKDMLDKV